MLRDADIREPLFEFLEETYGRVRILEEKITGRSRADVVMITPDSVCGLEIKSDADSYTRLAGQVKDYDRFYDYNYAVVGASHALHIKEHIPEYWGVITVEETPAAPDFYILRKPAPNPGVKLRLKMKILWRPELAQIQRLHDMPMYKDKSRDFVINAIVERAEYPEDKKGYIPAEDLNREISSILMERDYTLVDETILEYRKRESQKKLEKESDSIKRLELMLEKEEKSRNLKPGRKRCKSRRRR